MMWLKKLRDLFKREGEKKVEAPEEKPDAEQGLNEEMVSSNADMEPKESDGLAKIFEEKDGEKSENSASAAEEEKAAEETEESGMPEEKQQE